MDLLCSQTSHFQRHPRLLLVLQPRPCLSLFSLLKHSLAGMTTIWLPQSLLSNTPLAHTGFASSRTGCAFSHRLFQLLLMQGLNPLTQVRLAVQIGFADSSCFCYGIEV